MTRINGIVTRKLQTLDEKIGLLRSLGTITTADLKADWRTCMAVERALQVLVEVVIDVCNRILSLRQQTPAASGADAIRRCIELGILSRSDCYDRMTKFRNVIVHRYENIDSAILVDVVNRRLGDFEVFRDEVQRYAESEL